MTKAADHHKKYNQEEYKEEDLDYPVSEDEEID